MLSMNSINRQRRAIERWVEKGIALCLLIHHWEHRGMESDLPIFVFTSGKKNICSGCLVLVHSVSVRGDGSLFHHVLPLPYSAHEPGHLLSPLLSSSCSPPP